MEHGQKSVIIHTANYWEGHSSFTITEGVMKVWYLLAGVIEYECTTLAVADCASMAK